MAACEKRTRVLHTVAIGTAPKARKTRSKVGSEPPPLAELEDGWAILDAVNLLADLRVAAASPATLGVFFRALLLRCENPQISPGRLWTLASRHVPEDERLDAVEWAEGLLDASTERTRAVGAA